MHYNFSTLISDEGKCAQAENALLEISAAIRDTTENVETSMTLASYLLCRFSEFKIYELTLDTLQNDKLNLKEETVLAARELLSVSGLKNLTEMVGKYSSETYALATLLSSSKSETRFSRVNPTPRSIIQLAIKLLDLKETDSVADLCCGTGNFIIGAAIANPNAHYCGYEINSMLKLQAALCAELLESDIEITITDVFNLGVSTKQQSFDKIFANYPFAMRLKYLGSGTSYLDNIIAAHPGLSRSTSSDWVFNSLICDLLSSHGKAIGIMTNGSTWNSSDIAMRKYFIEHGLIECVIALPAKLFSYTSIPTSLVILSHDNDGVRLVDASNIYQSGRRQNQLSNTDIDTIVNAVIHDCDYSKVISVDELRQNDYVLNPERYLKYMQDEIHIENGVPFERIIISITRGAPCTAKQLDGMVSDDVTNTQYLMLSSIQDGLIDDNLPYLSSIDDKFKRYCLKNNDLILSKNGYPYKVAVAKVREGQQILASGNLYIIRINEELADPYYLKAFFESEQGISALKSISVGATIPNIGVDSLKKLIIPLPDIKTQKKIAEEYCATLDEVSMIKLRLEKAINRLHHVFDETKED